MPRWLQSLIALFQKEKPVPFPVNVTISCNPNPPAEGVTGYKFAIDGGAPVLSATPSATLSVPTAGSHVFTTVAENQWGDSIPDTTTVNINPAGKPTNIKIVKS